YGCAGQRCLAAAVVVGVGDAYEKVRDELAKQAAALRVGYGLDETTQMGTVISHDAKVRIEGMVAEGLKDGAELILDGRGCVVEGYEEGSFVGPTIISDVKPDMLV